MTSPGSVTRRTSLLPPLPPLPQANSKCAVARAEDWANPANQLAALTAVAASLAVQATKVGPLAGLSGRGPAARPGGAVGRAAC